MTTNQRIELINELLSRVLTNRLDADITIRISLINYLQKRDRPSGGKIGGEKIYFSIKNIKSPINMSLFRQDILDNYNFLLYSLEGEKYKEVTSIDLVLIAA